MFSPNQSLDIPSPSPRTCYDFCEGLNKKTNMISVSSKDIDECYNEMDHCDHNCTNTEGAYNCTCMSGYILMADGLSCLHESKTFVSVNNFSCKI